MGRVLVLSIGTILVGSLSYFLLRKTSKGKSDRMEVPKFLTNERDEISKALVDLIKARIDNISDEALIKMTRQLQFWINEGLAKDELIQVTERLIEEATITQTNFQVPTARFGKTELQMPIVTCGSMRFQYSWIPDSLPVRANKSVALRSGSQTNLKAMVRLCFRHGLTHFETARMYGTSEMQLVTVLKEMIDAGEVKREDFIFQTKVPVMDTLESFVKTWDMSWKICSALGYIDLFSLHCVSSPSQIASALAEGEGSTYEFVLGLQQEGKIKHIGFSTHGYSSGIMELIESNRFSYVNLHYHFFWSYHGSGTDDTRGGEGNLACLRRAKELDMGVFIISPLDKGGKLYKPSATMARTIGPGLSPISFGCLHVWESMGAHTASIGFSRLADFDDALTAAQLFTDPETKTSLNNAENRLTKLAQSALGEEWFKNGLLNVPHAYEPTTKLTGIGHILALHNLVKAFGMYEFAKDRYGNMMKVKWNTKKSFEENAKAMPGGNMGRFFDSEVDLTDALVNHYNPNLAKEKLQELHAWMTTGEQKTEWIPAYDLQTWPEYANTDFIISHLPLLVLESLTYGLIRAGGGPTKVVTNHAKELRQSMLAEQGIAHK